MTGFQSRSLFLLYALFIGAFFSVCFATPASAHILPGSYLKLSVDGDKLHGTWDLSLYSLAQTAGIEDEAEAALQHFALDKLSITADGKACQIALDPQHDNTLNPDDNDIPQVMHIVVTCPAVISKLTIDYFGLFVIDPQYQGLVNIMAHGQTFTSALSTQNPYVIFEVGTKEQAKAPDRWQQFRDYLREGVWHIWLGYDHILFLITLLLTAGFVRQEHHWGAREGFRATFWQVTKIVTSFTLAHSITLSLVIFGIVSLPSRLVESMIALSIAVAALNNLYPVMHKRLWVLTFFFGLIHGMGFAGALKELGLPDQARWLALVGFNAGVEVGQLTIVSAVLPAIYLMRKNGIYRRFILPVGSAAIIIVAMIWFIQRAFNLTLLGGFLGG